MYKANKRHQQPLLISNVNDLPEKHQQRLEDSWAGYVLSRVLLPPPGRSLRRVVRRFSLPPQHPVNVLVGLEALKSGFGWSDEELYDHFLFDLQVRYALGYHALQEGDFELRTLYNFRQRLSQYQQQQGVNLLARALEAITTQQLSAFKVHTGLQRMD